MQRKERKTLLICAFMRKFMILIANRKFQRFRQKLVSVSPCVGFGQCPINTIGFGHIKCPIGYISIWMSN
jgi:hypothetical protein